MSNSHEPWSGEAVAATEDTILKTVFTIAIPAVGAGALKIWKDWRTRRALRAAMPGNLSDIGQDATTRGEDMTTRVNQLESQLTVVQHGLGELKEVSAERHIELLQQQNEILNLLRHERAHVP